MPLGINIPSFPDVPMVPGVPAVLRNPQAAIGSLVNSAENAAIGAAQGLLGGVEQAVGNGIAAVNGAISNIQNLTGGSFGDIGTLVTAGFGDAPTQLTGDSPDISNNAKAADQWGVFTQAGIPIVEFDSFVSFEYKQEWRMPNYPMEQGAFQSYDKVTTPFIPRISLTRGGSDAKRKAFMDGLDAAANSLNLYYISTPEKRYDNVSIEGIDYTRTSKNGATLITAHLTFLEIRTTPTSNFTNTAAPNGANAVNSGTVQSVPLTTGPNTTNGQPTSSLQFAGGTSDAQQISPAASNVDPNTVQAVTNTQTPAVQATAPGTAQPPGITWGSQDPTPPTPTPPTVPFGEIDQSTGLAPSGGPFTDENGKPVNSNDLAASGGKGYTTDPHTGLIYATTFNSDGTQNPAKVDLTV